MNSSSHCPECNTPMIGAQLASTAKIRVEVMIHDICVATSPVASSARVCPNCGLLQASTTNPTNLNPQIVDWSFTVVEELKKNGAEAVDKLVGMCAVPGNPGLVG